MSNLKIIPVLLLWAYSISVFSIENNGFDEVCQIYTESKNSSMPINIASKYIMDNIQNRVTSKEVLQAHEAIMQAMGDNRYTLFKGSAEHVLKRTWNCSTMKATFDIEIK